MEDLRASYQELVSALTGVMEADDRGAGEAVKRLNAAKRSVTDACDALEHRLVAAQQRPAAGADAAAGDAAAAAATAAGASGDAAFIARLRAQR